ncbi:hypothetical protein ABZV64_29055 [Streptomyces sp. NPDC004959]|uniref:hypothetical protein n=1 Tax=unclassified Streptomyces TaxID=2593676 RepID=UPI00068D7609|nr:hypothetical protein [Streptomyces sp. NRRL F-5630]
MANEPQPEAAPTSSADTASCATCHAWRTEERRAETAQDHSRATDCRVMLQRHRADAHGGSE